MSEVSQEKSYQEQYDEAMKALEAGEQPKAAETQPEVKESTTSQPEEKPAEAKPEAAATPDPVEELRKKLDATEKALKDTQRWAHETNAKLKQQEVERRKQEFEAAKPEVLRQNPELEQAIRYATAAPQIEQEQQQVTQAQSWESIVYGAHPDLVDFQAKDPEMFKAAYERFETLPDKGNDPLNAIRALTEVKLEFAQKRAVEAAMQRAEAERAKRQTEKKAMSVPGGSGTVQADPVDPEAERAKKFWSMSEEEFQKETNRVMGLSR